MSAERSSPAPPREIGPLGLEGDLQPLQAPVELATAEAQKLTEGIRVAPQPSKVKRGSLLGINGPTIQFESKLRKLAVPVNRVARVVDVSKPEEDSDEPAAIADSPEGTVRATLADGSILVFEALVSRDGTLFGRSPIYGEMAIPTESIRRLNFGDFEKEKFDSSFEEWVVRPAKEPEFGKHP